MIMRLNYLNRPQTPCCVDTVVDSYVASDVVVVVSI